MFVRELVSVALFFVTATSVSGYSVTTDTPNVRVKENQGADLSCTYSADFGSNPRIEWKFQNLKGSQTYVVFDGKPTGSYANRVSLYHGNLRFNSMTRQDNGRYDCEVYGGGQFAEATVQVVVEVAPSPPMCKVPSSVITGTMAVLSCHDPDASPPPTYTWYKGNTPLPADPNSIDAFKNTTYKLNVQSGKLEFPSAAKTDSAQYYCQVSNGVGTPQSCKAMMMEVRDVNTGGIVAGVIVFLLLLLLLGLAIWFAYKRGYIPSPKR
ncbi:F11 receptor, tandem duplicate 1 [Betta splendens]|uniref:Junctional adhesion molecule A n=1 Tax=Betta splendens TaxID=158456 RepID=A0A9W2Y9B5_BETSP|nr:F11 receptor, tandem duplicate 1 [Betta splendens]